VDIKEAQNEATVSVPEDQLSLAIGKRGQNVRLAAKLTGWKIDIMGVKTGGEVVKAEEVSAETEETPEVKKEEKTEEVVEESKKPAKKKKAIKKKEAK
jgi:N utilization substance protein A